jgi:hypothetical protein
MIWRELSRASGVGRMRRGKASVDTGNESKRSANAVPVEARAASLKTVNGPNRVIVNCALAYFKNKMKSLAANE